MTTLLIWSGWFAWLAIFGWLAWRKKGRVLVVLGTVMVVTFVLLDRRITDQVTAASNRSGDMAAGLLWFAGAAVLLLPIAIAAVVYPIARFGPGILDTIWGIRPLFPDAEEP